jgi:hypothetical protein
MGEWKEGRLFAPAVAGKCRGRDAINLVCTRGKDFSCYGGMENYRMFFLKKKKMGRM